MMRAGLLLVCYATAIDVLPFVTTYDNVLPPEIVDEMLAEAKVLCAFVLVQRRQLMLRGSEDQ